MKASFALVRQGSFVLVGSATPSTPLTEVPFWRAPTLAVYYAKAFVSSLYTLPGQHAVQIRPDLKRLEVNGKAETYEPPSSATLQIIAQGGKVANAPQYVADWTRDFDYVYLLGPHGPNVLPDVLEELTAERRVTLDTIRKNKSYTSTPPLRHEGYTARGPVNIGQKQKLLQPCSIVAFSDAKPYV